MIKEKHVCKFTKEEQAESLLRDHREKINGKAAPIIVAKDILKQRKCECGKVITVDLERLG